MRSAKRALVALVAAPALVAGAYAQTTQPKQEMSVEESYLQESVETMVIREQSRAESRDMKLVALEYIGDAISAGRTNDEIQKSLEYLALEGVVNKAREGGVGRVTNNFPDVRAKACEYLGEVGTQEAKDSLVKVLLADPEPMVLSEAVRSLAKIGMNDNDEVTTAISWILTRFDVLNPDNSLAYAALQAFDEIAQKNNGIKDPSVVRVIVRIAEGPYITPVRAKAKEVLGNLRKYSAANQSKN